MARRKVLEKAIRYRGKLYRVVGYARKQGGIVANIVRKRRKK